MLSLDKDKIKVLLLEGIDSSAVKTFHENGYQNVELLKTALEGDKLVEKLQDAFILGIRSRTQVTKEVLSHAKKLFAVGCFCIGTNQVALNDAALHGIPVFNAPHANTRSVAELVIGLTVMLMRNIFPKSCAAHAGEWLKTVEGSREVRGKVIGIIGYGHIGSQVSILAEAFGMHVIYYDIVGKLPLGNAKSSGSLEELLEQSDVVTLHVPETNQTKMMMGVDQLEKMKKGSFLINASRGCVVDISTLKKQLDSGRIHGAAIDVFPEEPKEKSHEFISPLRGDFRVIMSPHIGGSTLEAQHNIGLEVSRKLIHYSDRGSTEGAVNFPSLSLPLHTETHRILNIHRNEPGMMQKINKSVADEEINVQSQYLLTNEQIGYVVLDIEKKAFQKLTKTLQQIKGSIKTRVLY